MNGYYVPGLRVQKTDEDKGDIPGPLSLPYQEPAAHTAYWCYCSTQLIPELTAHSAWQFTNHFHTHSVLQPFQQPYEADEITPIL